MNYLSKSMLMTALIAGSFTMASGAMAAEQTFTLDPMVVTAQRTETKDLATPATVTVISQEKLEQAGYKNVFDAIEHQVGLTSTGYGDAGQDFGFSSGRTVIRGYDRGTLVMLDGIPMNLKNYNSLDGIPMSMVERIEVIKGAAGTLYGSEAMGGVINIITKKPTNEKETIKVKGTVGNYYKDYGVTLSSENIILYAGKEYSDEYLDCNDYPRGSSTDWWIGKGQKSRAAIAAQLNEELGFNLLYQEGNITRGGFKAPSTKYDYRYDDKRIVGGFHYTGKDNGVKATLGYNYRKADGYDFVKNAAVSSSAELASYIGDVQKTWQLGKHTLISGLSHKHESYKNLVTAKNTAHRTNNALYLSYNHVFSDKFDATLGLRGELINDPVEDQEIFNPQIQTNYKFDDSTSWYINVGKAFQMPAVDSYYGKKAASGTLKPEEGWTYETGIKKLLDDNKSLRLAVYHMDFENKLGWSAKDPLTGEQEAINKGDFRNTGVEAEFTHRVNDNWTYTLGLGYGNPEINDPTGTAGWVQDAGRIDMLASVNYNAGKLRSGLTFKYLGDREVYNGKDVPSRNRLTWHTSYKFTANDSLSLTMNNIFDKTNYANRYGNLDLPYNWRVSYEHTF